MKDNYEELKKKYDLPDYKQMVRVFEIDSISKEDNILREILKKQHNKIEYYAELLESLLQPDTSLSSMKETGNLNSEDVTVVRKLFAECMYLLRKFTEFGLDYGEEEAAKFVVEINNEWKKIKLEIKPILVKLKEIWKKEYKTDYDKGYLG